MPAAKQFNGIFSAPPYAPLPRSYKKLGRLIVMVIALALVTAGLLWAYQTYFSPSARAYATSETYIKSLTTGEVDWAAYLSSDETAPSSLETAAAAVRGNYVVAAKTARGGAFYVLYRLSNQTNTYARTIVVKTDKGYRVSAFLYSGSPLALVPGDPVTTSTVAEVPVAPLAASSAAASGQGTPSGGSAPASGGGGKASTVNGVVPGTVKACLAQSDYTQAFDDADFGDGSYWTVDSPYSADVIFDPNVAVLPDDNAELYAAWGAFYRANNQKNFTIHLTASATADPSLAVNRTTAVRSALTASGVAAARIATDAPEQANTADTAMMPIFYPTSVCQSFLAQGAKLVACNKTHFLSSPKRRSRSSLLRSRPIS